MTDGELVELGDGRIWLADSGGDGPPLVLLHPGVGDSRIWDGALPALLDRFRVIRYDVRGYGRSPRPAGPYAMLADLRAVLDRLGLRRVHLAGCSMGGGTALGLAVESPERVASLVLLCPGVPGWPWPPDPAGDAEYERLAAAGDVAGLTEFGLRAWATSGHDGAARAQLRSAAAAWPVEDVHLRPDPPVFDRLSPGLGVPVRVLVGELDLPAAVDCAAATAARLGCEPTRLPGVDHLLPLRAPAETVAAVLAVAALDA
ncbi:alpha/beta fold hydrolase [Kitasatospora sp. NPDC088134]|uniref:alpha/beta fold hydrolase n=1 Tax=Kitasatospora sp. NPDC088134 TaxID=3364071 RepID=UPI0038125EF8